MRDGSSRTRDGRAYGRATTANYEGSLRRLVLPELGALPVATITRVRAVADLLGHADAALVRRRYTHTLPDELSDAAERLAEWRAQHR